MKREEFLRQLEYLLQDISEDDKRDAIDYYRDYLEEAGPEAEEDVLKEFGSPERIASIIRTDLLGGMNDAGEFTESGYDDQRFKTSAYPAVSSRRDGTRRGGYQSRGGYNPDTGSGAYQSGGVNGNKDSGTGQGGYEKGSYSVNRDEKKEDGNWWKYLLIALGILFLGPFVLAAVFGAAGTAMGFVITLAVILLVLAVLTVAGVLGGVALVVSGIILLFGSFWAGVMSIGLGLVFTGTGFLLLCCSWLFYGRFLPWAFMGIVNLCKKIFNKGNKSSGKKPVL